jgi:hypothetical protein
MMEIFSRSNNVDHVMLAAAIGIFAGICLVVFRAALLSSSSKKENTIVSSPALSSTTKPNSKREVFKCPFSQESSFIFETAEHLNETPIDLYQGWKDHLASRWLAAGLSGQDTPGMLRMGLKRLRNLDHFLVETPHQIREEIRMKKQALDDPARHDVVYVQEAGSLEAQAEVLELFVAYLPKRYPDMYSYDPKENSITVHPLDGETFQLSDWADRPLELCERIVQEDLVLMRPGPVASEGRLSKEGYYMAAAAVVFSFDALQEKLGKPAEFIHAPVPGYERHLRKGLNLFFNKLKPEAPYWRNNWGIGPSGRLDEPLYGSTSALEDRSMGTTVAVTRDDVRAKFLTVEYQTITRLPRTNYLLFTVRTFCDPLTSLEHVSSTAAVCLASSIRGMSLEMRAYKGIANEETCATVLNFLDSISSSSNDDGGGGEKMEE